MIRCTGLPCWGAEGMRLERPKRPKASLLLCLGDGWAGGVLCWVGRFKILPKGWEKIGEWREWWFFWGDIFVAYFLQKWWVFWRCLGFTKMRPFWDFAKNYLGSFSLKKWSSEGGEPFPGAVSKSKRWRESTWAAGGSRVQWWHVRNS